LRNAQRFRCEHGEMGPTDNTEPDIVPLSTNGPSRTEHSACHLGG
jgi:hypothetical protein